jgi:hypothetical protein
MPLSENGWDVVIKNGAIALPTGNYPKDGLTRVVRADVADAEIARLRARVAELEADIVKMKRARDRYREAWEAERNSRASLGLSIGETP